MPGYEESLRKVLPALHRAALRLGYDEEEAALVAQHVFLEAWTEQERSGPPLRGAA
ncbi:MAG TPA: hypothetical protein VKB65_13185 [Myxococcota bacterium]|nr:hypothetical protein [Myxococcota bacterium]